MIYFIQSEAGPIKIGFSDVDPRERLASCQTGSAWKLQLLGSMTGDRAREAALHTQFAEHRMQGEWFKGEIRPAVLKLLAAGKERICRTCLEWKAERSFEGDTTECRKCAARAERLEPPAQHSERAAPSVASSPLAETLDQSRFAFSSSTTAPITDDEGADEQMNLCGACGHDFSSVTLFDAHRVGKHAYLFDAEHLDGRRCLDGSEMKLKGWAQNRRGRWSDPVRSERVRTQFAEAL